MTADARVRGISINLQGETFSRQAVLRLIEEINETPRDGTITLAGEQPPAVPDENIDDVKPCLPRHGRYMVVLNYTIADEDKRARLLLNVIPRIGETIHVFDGDDGALDFKVIDVKHYVFGDLQLDDDVDPTEWNSGEFPTEYRLDVERI